MAIGGCLQFIKAPLFRMYFDNIHGNMVYVGSIMITIYWNSFLELNISSRNTI